MANKQTFRSKDGRLKIVVGKLRNQKRWATQWWENGRLVSDKCFYGSRTIIIQQAEQAIVDYEVKKKGERYYLTEQIKGILECNRGRVLEVHGIRPYSSHPKDAYLFIVLTKWLRSTGNEWVVSTWNAEAGGLGGGNYFKEDQLKEALAKFNERGEV